LQNRQVVCMFGISMRHWHFVNTLTQITPHRAYSDKRRGFLNSYG